MNFVSASEVRALERSVIHTTDDSLRIIRQAAQECAKELMPFGAVRIMCGKGNNGSDGYATAIALAQAGKRVEIVAVLPPATEEAKLLRSEAAQCGIPIVTLAAMDDAPFDAYLDAMLGIGISGTVSDPLARAIDYVNAHSPFTLAVDLPSGLDADTAAVCGTCVCADRTVTFTAPKAAMQLEASVDWCGEIVVRDVGVPAPTAPAPHRCMTAQLASSWLPPRRRSGNKGTFGKVFLLCGSRGMLGAAALAAQGAYQSGCGLVEIACTESQVETLNALVPEAVLLPCAETDGAIAASAADTICRAASSARAVVIGCGLGRGGDRLALVLALLAQCSAPMLLDADALNLLAESGRTDALDNRDVLITPHPLEFARLRGCTVAEIQADRLGAAADFAATHGVHVLLKGARSSIVASDGQSLTSLCSTSALAKGGSGDVLSGMAAGLRAQNAALTWDKAGAAAMHLHGRAGMLAAQARGAYSVTARDIASHIAPAILECDKRGRLR